MIQMLDDITRQTVFDSDQNLNHFVEVVAADVKHFDDPWENPVTKTVNLQLNSNTPNPDKLPCNMHAMHGDQVSIGNYNDD